MISVLSWRTRISYVGDDAKTDPLLTQHLHYLESDMQHQGKINCGVVKSVLETNERLFRYSPHSAVSFASITICLPQTHLTSLYDNRTFHYARPVLGLWAFHSTEKEWWKGFMSIVVLSVSWEETRSHIVKIPGLRTSTSSDVKLWRTRIVLHIKRWQMKGRWVSSPDQSRQLMRFCHRPQR